MRRQIGIGLIGGLLVTWACTASEAPTTPTLVAHTPPTADAQTDTITKDIQILHTHCEVENGACQDLDGDGVITNADRPYTRPLEGVAVTISDLPNDPGAVYSDVTNRNGVARFRVTRVTGYFTFTVDIDPTAQYPNLCRMRLTMSASFSASNRNATWYPYPPDPGYNAVFTGHPEDPLYAHFCTGGAN